jgi:hypothetical protein
LSNGLTGVRPQTKKSPALTLLDTFNLRISRQLLKPRKKRMMREEMSSLMTNRLRMTLIKREIPQPMKTNQRHLKLKRPKKKLKRRKREMTMVMKTQVTITMATTMERMITMVKTMIKRKKRRRETMIRRSPKKPKRERMTKRKEKMSMRVN